MAAAAPHFFWANFHSGYLVGVVLLGTYVVGSAVQQWRGGGSRTLSWADIRFLALLTGLSFWPQG
ncbi:MAG: hypothetical protein M5U34_22155 [Chloroflexi bacterium]|nr:hypothetical protein [Chloroflexota bacterium]